jgi:hypothetical protein
MLRAAASSRIRIGLIPVSMPVVVFVMRVSMSEINPGVSGKLN